MDAGLTKVARWSFGVGALFALFAAVLRWGFDVHGVMTANGLSFSAMEYCVVIAGVGGLVGTYCTANIGSENDRRNVG